MAAILVLVLNITFQNLYILERTLECKIRHSNLACDVKFKKTMLNHRPYISGEIMDFTAAILKLVIMINYSKNQALVS